MDYKEKYEQALKVAQRFYSNSVAITKKGLEDIFPELAESEDERIRKMLIEQMKRWHECALENNVVKDIKDSADAIAWLEKQGEQKHVVIPKFRIGDIIRWKKADSVEYTIKEINDKGYINTADGIMDISQTDIEFELVEQKPAEPEKDEESGFMEKVNRIVDFLKNDPYEQKLTEEIDSWFVDKDKEQQKPADKVESKFHEGDWVVSPNGVYWHIDKISNNRYKVTSNTGESSNWPLNTNIYHSFSIQDAKDGDVLACNAEILLFKSYSVGLISLYCWYNGQTNTLHGKGVVETLLSTRNKIYPATKEQRDQFEKAITEAGYEWDAEQKQLKKIEQKPAAWSEEDENRINRLIAYFEDKESFTAEDDIVYANWLKSLKERVQPKQEWSKEDKEMIGNIRSIIEKYAFSQSAVDVNGNLCEKEYIDADYWLKSLKDRVQPQPKSDWGEEVEATISLLKDIAEEQEKDYCTHNANDLRKAAQYLETCRHQSQWKPSEEQMDALQYIYRNLNPPLSDKLGWNSLKTLELLYNDLKKLREE